MSSVNLDLVKKLREETGAKFTECIEALGEAGGDLESAKDVLRTKGLAAAMSKTSRDAFSGAIGLFYKADKAAFMMKLQCETDYVARNETFASIFRCASDLAFSSGKHTTSELLHCKMPSGNTLEEEVKLAITATGENIKMDDSTVYIDEDSNTVLGTYVHKEYHKNIGKIGVIVVLKTDSKDAKVRELADNLAMQVAAMRPMALSRDRMDSAAIQRERDIQIAKAQSSGKPANIIDNMVNGSMEKFFKTVTLVDQEFVIGNSANAVSVHAKVAEIAKEVGSPITVADYYIYSVE